MFRENQKIGQYTLIKKLAKGGFGEVWQAEKQSALVTKKVAVKLPLDEQVDIETIKKEAMLWEEASGHPNVLPLIDADIYDGQVVIVSEYIESGSLADKVKREGKLSIEEAGKITIGILNGLEYLHSKKIIHRDIKPANVLMQGDMPRLADFGISRAMVTDTVSSTIVGTGNYMSPESFEGVRSEQSDIWSVGVLLYKLLTGRLPFPQLHPKEAMFAIIAKEPDPMPVEIPIRLQEIIYKTLAKNTKPDEMPPHRYLSAAEMRVDLEEFLQAYKNEPITAVVNPNFEESRGFATKMRIRIRDKIRPYGQNFAGLKLSQKAVLFSALGIVAAIVLLTVFVFDFSTDRLDVVSEAENAQQNSVREAVQNLPTEGEINQSKKLSREGDRFHRRKKYDEAVKSYTEAIGLTPNDYSLFNNRGVSYHTNGDYEKAIADYTKSVELNPYHFSAYNNRGAAYEDLGIIEQAVADYRKALELEPDNKTAKRNLEKILGKQ
ncbi:hypothetical protein BH20ACI4_BH20ACI4_06740 [soil metagenome]